jgi:nucleotide-binding universal stress UspA family protein
MKSQVVAPKPVEPKLRGREVQEAFGNRRKPITIRKILLPTDFSPASEQAFCYALQLALTLGSKLILLHVLEPATPLILAGRSAADVFSDEELAKMQENLLALTCSAQAAGITVPRSIVRTGIAPHEIAEAAREMDADLIVIATHGFTSWKHFTMGRTADRVACIAPCPVLVVREKEHDFL